MKLDSQVWRFITNEIMPTLDKYQDTINGIEKAQINIKKQISDFENEKKSLIKKVNEKESEVTSTLHTVNEINRILNMFGFTNFKISQAKEKGYYKLIREDGSDVKGTLSEGEYTFITFLYFYYLLKGSTNESGLIQDKIVVIDDPVSSLDSSVLFVVSNLIKNIISDCQNNKNGIKQIFILTHNVYFHKEVTFKGTSKNKSNQESYWVIKKLNDVSDIDEYSENPIQTTYELLWRELQDIETINKATIFNTLRRILEYYFNIIGGLDYEKCINKFDGEEKIICKTLISWINDGSHFINDDLAVHIEPETIEKYLGVFKEIFIRMDHESHYNMMMEKCDLT
jgi:wobble nucleotide-excising tRNase